MKNYNNSQKFIGLLLSILLIVGSLSGVSFNALAEGEKADYSAYNGYVQRANSLADEDLLPTYKSQVSGVKANLALINPDYLSTEQSLLNSDIISAGVSILDEIDTNADGFAEDAFLNHYNITFKIKKGTNGSITENKNVSVAGGRKLEAIPYSEGEYTSSNDDYNYVFRGNWKNGANEIVSSEDILDITFTGVCSFIAIYEKEFASADYTAFNEAKAHAETILAQNDVSNDVKEKIESLIANGYNEGSPYGKGHQSIVTDAAESITVYLSKIDRDDDNIIDDDKHLSTYKVEFYINGEFIHRDLVKAGSISTYDRIVANNPKPIYDENKHSVFKEWEGVPEEVIEDCIVNAVFEEAVDHEFEENTSIKNSTCTEKGYTGDIKCKYCDYIQQYGEETDILGHDFKIKDRISVIGGSYSWLPYICNRCGEGEVLLTLSPKDGNESAVQGADVTITSSEINIQGKTDENGTFTTPNNLPDGEYTVSIIQYDQKIKGDGVLIVSKGSISGRLSNNGILLKYRDCRCVCHNGNVVSKSVRWFCTLISVVFRTEFKCCDDMDWYGGLSSKLD